MAVAFLGQSNLATLPPPSALTSVALIPNTSRDSLQAPTTVTWSLPQGTPGLQAPVVMTPSRFSGVPTLATGQPMTSPPSGLGLSLSLATEPIPQKLVDKILAGQFVEMRELLTDNIALLNQLDTFGGQAPIPILPGALKPRLREITSLPSWIYCFLAFVAVKSPDPGTRDMLAYARLIIRESQRHSGGGWLDYDRVFRQQAAMDSNLRWNTLNPNIQAATLLGQAPVQSRFCTLCREPDHDREHCALAYLQQPLGPVGPVPANTPSGPRPRGFSGRRSESRMGICISWNKGRCVFPGTCTFRHVCATCLDRHMARDCPRTPHGSEYRRDGRSTSRGQPRDPPKPGP